MLKTYLTPDLNDSSKMKIERRTQAPKGGHVIPKALEHLPPEALEVKEITDEFGSVSKVVQKNEIRFVEIEKEKEYLNNLEESARDIDHLKPGQSEALDALMTGVGLEDLKDRWNMYNLFQYRGGEMSKRLTYNAIVLNADDSLAIKEISKGVRPSNLVRVAPEGFVPGDEKFIKLKANRVIEIDWAGRKAKFKSTEKSIENERAINAWNKKTITNRLKGHFFGG